MQKMYIPLHGAAAAMCKMHSCRRVDVRTVNEQNADQNLLTVNADVWVKYGP